MSTLRRKLGTGLPGIAGKCVVACNAIHYGPLSNSTLLSGEPGQRFRQIPQGLTIELEPTTERELALVDRMAISRWNAASVHPRSGKTDHDQRRPTQTNGTNCLRLSSAPDSDGIA